MNKFLFKAPTKILFGVNEALNVGELLVQMNMKNVFIVTDKTIEKMKPFSDFLEKLISQEFICQVFSDTVTDPSIEVVDAAAKILKESKSDVVIAVGGGSTIDTAKAMCMLVTNEGSVREYLFGGTKSVANPSHPLFCIPTTAGSGSEVTAASVITDNQNDIKLSVSHEYLMPRYAIVDPIMQKGMPPIITASTGMDAMTHAIEAFVSLNANVISDAYALMAMQLINENIRTATYHPEDLDSRSNMALASVMAATAFVNGGLGAVHGIAQAMGGIAHTPHGIANSLLLPYVMEMNAVGNLKKFAKIAEVLGVPMEGLSLREAAFASVESIKKLVSDLRIPTKLNQVDVTKDMFDTIVKGTMEYRLLPCNPVKVRDVDVYEILEKAYE